MLDLQHSVVVSEDLQHLRILIHMEREVQSARQHPLVNEECALVVEWWVACQHLEEKNAHRPPVVINYLYQESINP